jgi:hypothetical protein
MWAIYMEAASDAQAAAMSAALARAQPPERPRLLALHVGPLFDGRARLPAPPVASDSIKVAGGAFVAVRKQRTCRHANAPECGSRSSRGVGGRCEFTTTSTSWAGPAQAEERPRRARRRHDLPRARQTADARRRALRVSAADRPEQAALVRGVPARRVDEPSYDRVGEIASNTPCGVVRAVVSVSYRRGAIPGEASCRRCDQSSLAWFVSRPDHPLHNS